MASFKLRYHAGGGGTVNEQTVKALGYRTNEPFVDFIGTDEGPGVKDQVLRVRAADVVSIELLPEDTA
jgi:hypothetical protein